MVQGKFFTNLCYVRCIFDRNIGWAKNSVVKRCIGFSEVDHLFPLGIFSQRRYGKVNFTCGQIWDAVRAGHRYQLKLCAQILGNKLSHINIITNGLHVRAN